LSSVDVGRDIEDFRRFMLLDLFRLRLYKTFEEGKPVYCVGLVVRCEDPEGWVVTWRRCYDSLGKATELYNAVEPIARNRLRELLRVVEAKLPSQ
jgi:hypothetical protein